MRLEPTHDLTHVTNTLRVGLGQGLIDQCGKFVVIELFWQVGFEHRESGRLFLHQIVTATFAKLLNRITTLLDHFLNHGKDFCFVKFSTFVDLTALDGGAQQSDRLKAHGLFGPHGIFHVGNDTFFERRHMRTTRS